MSSSMNISKHVSHRLSGLRGALGTLLVLCGAAGVMGLPAAGPRTVVKPAEKAAEEPAEKVKSRPPASVTLVAAKGGRVKAGETVDLGLAFKVDKEWHIYWKGLNDTGMAPTVELELPAGWKRGEMLWPAPSRYVAPGDIVDHILEGEPLIILPVTVPKDAKPGRVTLKGRAAWLVCKDLCLRGAGDVQVDVDVVADDAAPAKPAETDVLAAKFAATRAMVARPLPSDGSVKADFDALAGKVVFFAKGAAGLTYFPEVDTRRASDMLSGVSSDGEMLTVAFASDQSQLQISGVLEVKLAEGKDGAGTKQWYQVRLPVAEAKREPAK